MSIATDTTTEQLIAELYKIDGKAEIVDGRIVMMSPTGRMPGSAGVRRFVEVCERMRSRHRVDAHIPTMLPFLLICRIESSFAPDAAY